MNDFINKYDYYSYQGTVHEPSAYLVSRPKLPLNYWVQEFWQLNVPHGNFFYRSVPDNCVDLIINLTAPEEIFIVTPFSSSKLFEMEGAASYFGIRFQILGYQGVISAPIGSWSNNENIADAEDVLPKQIFNLLLDGSQRIMSFPRRCEYFSSMLLGVVQDYKVDPRLVHFMSFCHKNMTSSTDLSNKQCLKFGISARHLRRLTSQYLGLSPREFAKVLRFQQTLRFMNTEEPSSMWNACYYDQSHFIRDFKKMSGVTPSEFQRVSVLYNTD